MTDDIAKLAAGLNEDERYVLSLFPELRPGNPVRLEAAVTFGSLWRKFPPHWRVLLCLERAGIVERRVTRGETLWRPTKPLGLAVKAHFQGARHDQGA